GLGIGGAADRDRRIEPVPRVSAFRGAEDLLSHASIGASADIRAVHGPGGAAELFARTSTGESTPAEVRVSRDTGGREGQGEKEVECNPISAGSCVPS